MQSQVRFNRGEGSGEGLGGFGAEPDQVPQGSGEGSGSTGLASQHASERFAKIKRYGCWGYHRSFFVWWPYAAVPPFWGPEPLILVGSRQHCKGNLELCSINGGQGPWVKRSMYFYRNANVCLFDAG